MARVWGERGRGGDVKGRRERKGKVEKGGDWVGRFSGVGVRVVVVCGAWRGYFWEEGRETEGVKRTKGGRKGER